MRRLRSYVHVDGTVYGPNDVVPPAVAEQITNPRAWAEPADMFADEPEAKPPRRKPGPKPKV